MVGGWGRPQGKEDRVEEQEREEEGLEEGNVNEMDYIVQRALKVIFVCLDFVRRMWTFSFWPVDKILPWGCRSDVSATDRV